jgi:hypothetical protein
MAAEGAKLHAASEQKVSENAEAGTFFQLGKTVCMLANGSTASSETFNMQSAKAAPEKREKASIPPDIRQRTCRNAGNIINFLPDPKTTTYISF